MRVLGIDPGYGRVGFGLVEKQGSKLTAIDYGVIETPQIAMPDRLSMIYERTLELFREGKPDALATERLLFTVNKTTAMDVSKALGVILLASAREGLPWGEYSPPEVKQSVVGNGAAEKKQVQFMVARLLSLGAPPKPDDAADALAIAICHLFRAGVPARR